jgi:hypothetical protein
LIPGTGAARGCYRLDAPIVGLADVQSARAFYETSNSEWAVSVTFTKAAAPRFVKAMQANVGRQVAIVIDGRVVTAPVVNAGITGGTVSISGTFDERLARQLAARLSKPPSADALRCAAELSRFVDPTKPGPAGRRLDKAGMYWFGQVHLDPPPAGVRPLVSAAQAWRSVSQDTPLYALHPLYRAGVYDVVLAYWTSGPALVMESNGKRAAHDHVLAWVILGKHVPSGSSAVGRRCVFGSSIDAINATTGEGIVSVGG